MKASIFIKKDLKVNMFSFTILLFLEFLFNFLYFAGAWAAGDPPTHHAAELSRLQSQDQARRCPLHPGERCCRPGWF